MAPSPRFGRVLLVGGALFGIGLAAVLDVLVFHQILQTHHLLSNWYTPYTPEGLQQNIYYDGLFALAMLGVTLSGAALVWWAANRSSHRLSTLQLAGSVFFGMGLFNTVDGIVSHYILDIHDAVHNTAVWNPHWILVSVVLVVLGVALFWQGRR